MIKRDIRRATPIMPGVKRVRDNEGEERESENEEGDQESDSERSSLEESISSDGTESDDSSGKNIVHVVQKCSVTDHSGDLSFIPAEIKLNLFWKTV